MSFRSVSEDPPMGKMAGEVITFGMSPLLSLRVGFCVLNFLSILSDFLLGEKLASAKGQ